MPTSDFVSFESKVPPDHLSPPLQALWWLKKGGLEMGPAWETAHRICQQDEGNRDYDIVHALAHWIEGDAANRDYWYRRASATRAATIAEEWQKLVTTLQAEPHE